MSIAAEGCIAELLPLPEPEPQPEHTALRNLALAGGAVLLAVTGVLGGASSAQAAEVASPVAANTVAGSVLTGDPCGSDVWEYLRRARKCPNVSGGGTSTTQQRSSSSSTVPIDNERCGSQVNSFLRRGRRCPPLPANNGGGMVTQQDTDTPDESYEPSQYDECGPQVNSYLRRGRLCPPLPPGTVIRHEPETIKRVLTYEGGMSEVQDVWGARAEDAAEITYNTGKSVVKNASVEGPKNAYQIIKEWFGRAKR